MPINKVPVQDKDSDRNFEEIARWANSLYLGVMTATQISNLDLDYLTLGCMVYDSTNDVMKFLTQSGGNRVFVTISTV